MGFFDRIKAGLKKTRDSMVGKIEEVFHAFKKIDEDFFEELLDTLIMSDVGVHTAEKICDELRKRVKKSGEQDSEKVKGMLKEIIVEIMGEDCVPSLEQKPAVILVIGVNGVGKTTSIGKMAHYYKSQGKKVVLGAADTFRAAAIDQLKIWAERAGVDIICHAEGSDPAAVVFDTLQAGKARNADVIICDTAGRLHNKKNLMDELSKIGRIICREMGEVPTEALLVLDATTGQNGVNQAKLFAQTTDLTGIVLTKLDGTAKGGVVIAIREETGLPVKFIGVGEQMDDLQPFCAKDFADALFEA